MPGGGSAFSVRSWGGGLIDWLKLLAWTAVSLLKLVFREKKDVCITSVESLMKQRRTSGLFSFQPGRQYITLAAS